MRIEPSPNELADLLRHVAESEEPLLADRLRLAATRLEKMAVVIGNMTVTLSEVVSLSEPRATDIQRAINTKALRTLEESVLRLGPEPVEPSSPNRKQPEELEGGGPLGREHFEERVFATYFISGIKRVPGARPFELVHTDMTTKAELCARDEKGFYQREELSAMWWGWSKAVEALYGSKRRACQP